MLVVIYSVTELNFLTVVTALSTEQESKGLGSKEDELFFFFFSSQIHPWQQWNLIQRGIIRSLQNLHLLSYPIKKIRNPAY